MEPSNWNLATHMIAEQERKQIIDITREVMIAYYMIHGRWPTTEQIDEQIQGKRGW